MGRTPEPSSDDGRAEAAWARLRKKPGTIKKIANGLNVTLQAVSQWTKVPLDRVVDVEQITGVPRAHLRPGVHLPARRNSNNTKHGRAYQSS
jgi:hypothetical protein